MDNYTVVINNNLYNFKIECNNLVLLGYIPAGGIFIIEDNEHGESFFYQAFYRKEIK
jgi:hypothetical protein